MLERCTKMLTNKSTCPKQANHPMKSKACSENWFFGASLQKVFVSSLRLLVSEPLAPTAGHFKRIPFASLRFESRLREVHLLDAPLHQAVGLSRCFSGYSKTTESLKHVRLRPPLKQRLPPVHSPSWTQTEHVLLALGKRAAFVPAKDFQALQWSFILMKARPKFETAN